MPAAASSRACWGVNSPNDAVNGFWTQLGNADASAYDHFEFWVKGDEKSGYPTLFKIEFKKFQKDAEGNDETITAGYIVKGVSAQWQKISVPLNVMNGISDWRDILPHKVLRGGLVH